MRKQQHVPSKLETETTYWIFLVSHAAQFSGSKGEGHYTALDNLPQLPGRN